MAIVDTLSAANSSFTSVDDNRPSRSPTIASGTTEAYAATPTNTSRWRVRSRTRAMSERAAGSAFDGGGGAGGAGAARKLGVASLAERVRLTPELVLPSCVTCPEDFFAMARGCTGQAGGV